MLKVPNSTRFSGEEDGGQIVVLCGGRCFWEAGVSLPKGAAEKLLTGIKQLLGIRYRKMIDAVRVRRITSDPAKK